jgi:hypothetical protein
MDVDALIEADHRPNWSLAELTAFRPVKLYQVLWIARHAPDYHERSAKARGRARGWARQALSEQIFGGASVMRIVQGFRRSNDLAGAHLFADRVEDHARRWAWGEGLDVRSTVSRYLALRGSRSDERLQATRRWVDTSPAFVMRRAA